MRKNFLIIFTVVSGLLILTSCEGNIVNSCNTQQPDTQVEAKFSSIQENIFSPTCATAGCHTGSFPAFGLDLSAGAAYDNLLDSDRDYVIPGDADASLLVGKVLGTASGGIMPPASVGTLSDEEKQAIIDWINDGAENN